ncbi:hypothetical protein [Xenorhabdus bovienii]|nr:hypothetical protein [Xenorhabdus bovienii]
MNLNSISSDGWVTMNGGHVFIGKNGEIKSGDKKKAKTSPL